MTKTENLSTRNSKYRRVVRIKELIIFGLIVKSGGNTAAKHFVLGSRESLETAVMKHSLLFLAFELFIISIMRDYIVKSIFPNDL